MKKTVLLLFAIVMALVSVAQPKGNTITPTGTEMWWGYFTENDADASNFHGVGVNAQANYEAAVRIVKNNPLLSTATIKGVRLWLKGSTIPKITRLRVWATSTALKNNAVGVDYVEEVDIATLTEGANDIAFTTPYEIVGTKNCNVGFTMELSSQDTPVMCGGEWEDNSFWFRATVNSTTWQQKKTDGKLAFQVLVDGANIPDNAAAAADFGTHYAQVNHDAVVPVTIIGKGKNPVSSISYVVITDGDASTATPEVTVPMNNVPYNGNGVIDVTLDASQAMSTTRSVVITKVNGEPNGLTADECAGNGQLVVLEYLFTKVPVVEEFTGTWCGWCPRGFTAMEMAHETYGDRAVLIAAHNADPMEIADYNPVMALVGGFPSAFIDRVIDVDPHPTELLPAIEDDMITPPDGKIDITAKWNDEEMTKIDIVASPTFAFGTNNADYGIALVLTNDGLKGSGSQWAQANYYNDQHDPVLDEFWYGKGSKVSGLTFNHVAVAAWDIKYGIDGSVPTSFQAGEALPFAYCADISSKTVIQDKTKLHAIALLIDRKTGKIVNAGQTDIEAYGAAVPGDVDGDGVVTSGDITALYNYLLNEDNSAIVNGDLDGDGTITAGDVTIIYNILLND